MAYNLKWEINIPYDNNLIYFLVWVKFVHKDTILKLMPIAIFNLLTSCHKWKNSLRNMVNPIANIYLWTICKRMDVWFIRLMQTPSISKTIDA